jgi:hypothetical protein
MIDHLDSNTLLHVTTLAGRSSPDSNTLLPRHYLTVSPYCDSPMLLLLLLSLLKLVEVVMLSDCPLLRLVLRLVL